MGRGVWTEGRGGVWTESRGPWTDEAFLAADWTFFVRTENGPKMFSVHLLSFFVTSGPKMFSVHFRSLYRSLFGPCIGPASVPVSVPLRSLYRSLFGPCIGPASVPASVPPRSLLWVPFRSLPSLVAPLPGCPPRGPPLSPWPAFAFQSFPLRSMSRSISIPKHEHEHFRSEA